MPRRNQYAATIPASPDELPRLHPSPGLTPAEATVFTELVNSKHASHFRESDRAALDQTARAIAFSHQIAAALAGEPLLVPGQHGPRPNPLIAVQRGQARLISTLLTRLRMTPQARISKDKAATTSVDEAPNVHDALRLVRSYSDG